MSQVGPSPGEPGAGWGQPGIGVLEPPTPASDPPGTSWLAGVVRTARPRQWVKNLLVFAAPGAAGVLTHAAALSKAAEAFGVMCLVASGIYFLNDAADKEADQSNLRTRRRPVAAGVVPVGHAIAIGTGMVVLGAALSPLVSVKLALVVSVYVAVSVAYVLWLKAEPVVDMATVASGFVLRAVAGAVAVGVPISEWFLIVATFGSLFIVSGKRLADLRSTECPASASRRARPTYSEAFLRSILVMSLSATITAYCLWAFENVKVVNPHEGHAALCFQLSIIPFTLALMRYGLLVDQGRGGAPEEVAFGDSMLVVLGLVWTVVFAFGVYV